MRSSPESILKIAFSLTLALPKRFYLTPKLKNGMKDPLSKQVEKGTFVEELETLTEGNTYNQISREVLILLH